MVKEPTAVRWLLRVLVCGYVFLLVVWPVSLVVRHTFADGLNSLNTAFADPEVQAALLLTLRVAGIAVLINLVFGVTMSILLVRYEFPGKRALSAMLDVPLSVSPVVVGLALVLVYNGSDGWFGPPAGGAELLRHLRLARHDHGDLLRGAAPGDPRGRPGPHRGRRRPGAGRAQSRSQRSPDLLEDHPAQHQVGGRLRRGAQPRPVPR